jgi:hypothetical protein
VSRGASGVPRTRDGRYVCRERLSFDSLTFGCRPDRLAASPARRQGQPDNQDSTCRTFASVEAALGLIAVVAVAITRTWTPTIDPAVLLAAPAIGTITGALAGITPAIKAAHTHPPTPSADKGVQHRRGRRPETAPARASEDRISATFLRKSSFSDRRSSNHPDFVEGAAAADTTAPSRSVRPT